MKYALLIYSAEMGGAQSVNEEQRRVSKEYWVYTTELQEFGKLLSRGPFADIEAKLGGIHVVDANGLDEAIALAERVVTAHMLRAVDGGDETRCKMQR
jgi:hypothetical protein